MAGLVDRRRPAQADDAAGHRVPRHAARPASASTASRSTAATARATTNGEQVHRLLRRRRGQRADRRAAGVLPHRHRRRLRHQPRARRADRPVAVRRLPADPGARHRRQAAATRWTQLRELGPVLPDAAGHVLVRRRAVVQQLRPGRRHRRGRPSRSATGSTSTCSASRAWRCRGRRWRSSRSSWRCSCASPAPRACCGCRASSPTTRGCSTRTSGSPAASPS